MGAEKRSCAGSRDVQAGTGKKRHCVLSGAVRLVRTVMSRVAGRHTHKHLASASVGFQMGSKEQLF